MEFLMWLGIITVVALIVICISFGGYAGFRAITNEYKGDRVTGIVTIILMMVCIYFLSKLLM